MNANKTLANFFSAPFGVRCVIAKSAISGVVNFLQIRIVSYARQNSGSQALGQMHESCNFELAPHVLNRIACTTFVRIVSKWTCPSDEMAVEWYMLGQAETFKHGSFWNLGATLLESLLQKGANFSIFSSIVPFVDPFGVGHVSS